MNTHNLVVCGGTFDHFHKGHREFLRFTLAFGKKAIVGITSNTYAKAKDHSDTIESFAQRKKSVENFLQQEHIVKEVKIIQIHDVYGITLEKDLAIDVIVVTKDSQEGAQRINKMRKEKGLKELVVEIAPLIFGEDGKVISSSRIRNGEINREGRLYINPQWVLRKRVLSESLRQELKHPLGVLFTDTRVMYQQIDAQKTITVGDVVTKAGNDVSFGQKFSVVDFHVGRERKFENLSELGFLGLEKIVKVNNPRGFLTASLFASVSEIFHTHDQARIVFLIHGEEDLSVLPFLLASPLGFVIFYGQPKEGVVKIVVSEKTKEYAYDIVCRFVQDVL